MLPAHQANEIAIVYDGTFEGLLSAVFDIYDRKLTPVAITADRQTVLFGQQVTIETDPIKADRVFNGMCRYGRMQTCNMIFYAFLSNAEHIEMDIFRYLKLFFHYKRDIAPMLSETYILRIHQMQKRVSREAERMRMFIRFEQANDGTFFAPIAPAYDVLRLVISHFKDRFVDQPWIIYDTRRKYGAYYNGSTVELISIEDERFSIETGRLNSDIVAEQEMEYQRLWRRFFDEIAIKERKNLRVQQNFMPKRFWKYLTEKKL